MNTHLKKGRAETTVDRIRALAAERAAQGRPLQYEDLPAICDGSRIPCITDLSYIADEAGVRIETLLGIRGLARARASVRRRIGRTYWGLWRGIRPSPFQAKVRAITRAVVRR
ncbi:hypothetical protein [Streptomyces goshikiensis]|uniref:hypothetical protein n=1 Tax=Streptomyces goshikiensis TaxID=1942 RepID=UPI0036A4C5A8